MLFRSGVMLRMKRENNHKHTHTQRERERERGIQGRGDLGTGTILGRLGQRALHLEVEGRNEVVG